MRELLEPALVDIDPLDAAAALSRIEAGTVHQTLDGLAEVGILAHISGVFPAELQVGRDERLCCGTLHSMPTSDRARERYQLRCATGDDPQRRCVIQMQVLEHSS